MSQIYSYYKFPKIYHKRGDTFQHECQYLNMFGSPVDITSYTISSKIRSVNFEYTFTVTKTDAVNGKFTITAPSVDTATWPVKTSSESTSFCDIQLVNNGVTRSTVTLEVIIIEDITY